MAHTYDVAGKSGETYRYTLLEGQPIWPSGGNYLYVKMARGGPKVLFAGETESLFRGYAERWDEARSEHGATDILLRLNVAGGVRRAECDDIIARHKPPMNGELAEESDDRASEGEGDNAAP